MRSAREVSRSKGAAIWNVVICAAIIAVTLYFGFTGQPIAFAVAGIGVLMEVYFVRNLMRAVREGS